VLKNANYKTITDSSTSPIRGVREFSNAEWKKETFFCDYCGSDSIIAKVSDSLCLAVME